MMEKSLRFEDCYPIWDSHRKDAKDAARHSRNQVTRQTTDFVSHRAHRDHGDVKFLSRIVERTIRLKLPCDHVAVKDFLNS